MCGDMNLEAAVSQNKGLTTGSQKSSQTKSKKSGSTSFKNSSPTKSGKVHRCDEFATDDPKGSASMIQMMETKSHLTTNQKMKAALAKAQAIQEMPIRPRQVNPIKEVHFSSPLRG